MRSKDPPRPQPPRAHSLPPRRRRRPLFDLLEDRVVLSRIITVNTLSDAAPLPTGQVSLRAAIAQADADMGDLIGDGSGETGLADGSQGNLVGSDAHPIDPILSPLGNHGGPTQTVALLPGSPAIGAGSPAHGPATDQRGVVRGASVDIGACQTRGFTIGLVAGSSPQSAYVGSGFANPLAVVVVTYTVNPVGGAGAILDSATATIGTGGVASVKAAANSTAGAYTVVASASGATTAATFKPTNLAQAQVSGVSVSWGTSRTAALTTASDGPRLLAAGRKIDVPWLDIRKITIILDQAATLTAADVSVTGLAVASHGPVTITGSGTTYVITLAVPIDAADRVTLTIKNAAIATYTRRIDVLPGDVNDDGSEVIPLMSARAILRRATGLDPATPPYLAARQGNSAACILGASTS